jgi:hypothetical protein
MSSAVVSHGVISYLLSSSARTRYNSRYPKLLQRSSVNANKEHYREETFPENLLDSQTQPVSLSKTQQPLIKCLTLISKPSFWTKLMRLLKDAGVHVVGYDIAADTGSCRQEYSLTVVSAKVWDLEGLYLPQDLTISPPSGTTRGCRPIAPW